MYDTIQLFGESRARMAVKKKASRLIMPEESHSFLKASLMNSTKYQFFSDKTNYFAVCM